MQEDKNYSDYVIYVDESGDHGLKSIDPQYPVFALVFCIFEKKYFCNHVVPSFKELKFKYWGYDAIILHSSEIRKSEGDFIILDHIPTRSDFLSDLSDKIDKSEFILIATGIDKNKLKYNYADKLNPYNIALHFCIEMTQRFLISRNQSQKITHVVIEKRGKQEDELLELEFRRIAYNGLLLTNNCLLEPVFADKKHNSIGLQIADLTAHPVGRHIINPTQDNKAYDIIAKKFYKEGVYESGMQGLKIFPS